MSNAGKPDQKTNPPSRFRVDDVVMHHGKSYRVLAVEWRTSEYFSPAWYLNLDGYAAQWVGEDCIAVGVHPTPSAKDGVTPLSKIPTPEYVFTAELLVREGQLHFINAPARVQELQAAVVNALRAAYNDGFRDAEVRMGQRKDEPMMVVQEAAPVQTYWTTNTSGCGCVCSLCLAEGLRTHQVCEYKCALKTRTTNYGAPTSDASLDACECREASCSRCFVQEPATANPTDAETVITDSEDSGECERCGSVAPEEGFEHLIDSAHVITCRPEISETTTPRKHVDAVLRRGLGPKLWNQFWGAELEQLGGAVDELCRNVHADAVREARMAEGKDGDAVWVSGHEAGKRTGGENERNIIISWLREYADEAEMIPGPAQYEDALRNAADSIERGEHLEDLRTTQEGRSSSPASGEKGVDKR